MLLLPRQAAARAGAGPDSHSSYSDCLGTPTAAGSTTGPAPHNAVMYGAAGGHRPWSLLTCRSPAVQDRCTSWGTRSGSVHGSNRAPHTPHPSHHLRVCPMLHPAPALQTQTSGSTHMWGRCECCIQQAGSLVPCAQCDAPSQALGTARHSRHPTSADPTRTFHGAACPSLAPLLFASTYDKPCNSTQQQPFAPQHHGNRCVTQMQEQIFPRPPKPSSV
jgi:hypothetical protein